MKNIFRLSLLVAFIGILSAAVIATEKGKPEVATATMQGVITDTDTQETLAGVTVKVEGTDIEVKTDLDGKFAIDGLIPGDYNLEVSYISYKETKVLQSVSCDSKSQLNLGLKSE